MYKNTLLLLLLLYIPSVFADATGLSHDAFEKLRRDNPESVLLDVRSAEEYAEGFIKGAINIPHTEVNKILAKVSADDTVILYCRSGRRAGIVAKMLATKGYKKLYQLDGDMNDWLAKGKPIVKPDS